MTRKEQIYIEIDKDKCYADCPDDYEYGFIRGVEWADKNPDTEDLEAVMAYTFRGLGWLAENIEADMGTTRERALGCVEILQFLCNDVIMELRKSKR